MCMYKNVSNFICQILSKKLRKTTKKAHKRYQNLSKEKKRKKQQYDCERYKNLSEDEKQKLVEYRKKYYRMRKK